LTRPRAAPASCYRAKQEAGMIIYTLIITKDGETIFSHDIALNPDQPFAKDVSEAFEVFRMNFKETSLMEENVAIRFEKKDS
jgi:hypothetical protein